MASGRSAYYDSVRALDQMVRRQATIVIGDGSDPEIILSGVFSDPEMGGQMEVRLQRGGYTHKDEKMVESYIDYSPFENISVLPDQKFAVGYLITFLETIDIDEDAAWEWVSDAVDVSEYKDWLDSLSYQDRRNRLLDQSERYKEEDPATEKVMEIGEWRDTDLGSESVDIVRELAALVFG